MAFPNYSQEFTYVTRESLLADMRALYEERRTEYRRWWLDALQHQPPLNLRFAGKIDSAAILAKEMSTLTGQHTKEQEA